MRIIVIGAGNAGTYLAAKLSEEQHDIVIIDRDYEALKDIQTSIDVQTIEGDGSNPEILEDAGIRKAQLLVAVTDRDEVNILACCLANLVGVPLKVARITSKDYYQPGSEYDIRRLGIDLVVSQNEECADEIFTMLRMPGTIEAVDLLKGKVLAVGIKVHMDSPMVFQTLGAFPEPDLLRHVRCVGIMRGNDLIMPDGSTQLMIGDDMYLVGQAEHLTAFLQWANPEYAGFEKIVVAGGGDLGLQLAQRLEQHDCRVVLIERDEERAEYCAEQLDRTLVLRGDALSPETLSHVDIVKSTAFVAATGDDETNIMICLLGEKAGATFTVAQVAKPDYVPIISSLSLLDRAVSSHVSMINSILHAVRGKNVHAAAVLQKLKGELLEIGLTADSPWAGRSIGDLDIPDGMIIATIQREQEILVPTGDQVLMAGDHLVIFLKPGMERKVHALVKS